MEMERAFSKGVDMRRLLSVLIVLLALLMAVPAIAQWSFNPISNPSPPTSVWNPGIPYPTAKSIEAKSQWGSVKDVPESRQRIERREVGRYDVRDTSPTPSRAQPINDRF